MDVYVLFGAIAFACLWTAGMAWAGWAIRGLLDDEEDARHEAEMAQVRAERDALERQLEDQSAAHAAELDAARRRIAAADAEPGRDARRVLLGADGQPEALG